MIRIPTQRSPTHPGEMLLEEFLTPMGVSQRKLADAIHVPSQELTEILSEHQSVTPSIAPRLGKFFGVSAAFWMNVQQRWDLYYPQQAESETLKTIRPHGPLDDTPKGGEGINDEPGSRSTARTVAH